MSASNAQPFPLLTLDRYENATYCSGWGATGISDTYTALLYELAFTATGSVSGYCCKLSNVELG